MKSLLKAIRRRFLSPVINELVAQNIEISLKLDKMNEISIQQNERILLKLGMISENNNNRELPFLYNDNIEELSGCFNSDLELLSKYADLTTKPIEGYHIDFTGIKTSPIDLGLSFWNHLNGTVNHNLPLPDDSFHAMGVEYCSLFFAIEHSTDSFTMFEFGAGYGTWMAYTAKACIRRGIEKVNVIGIEGDKNKIPLIMKHLQYNNFRDDSNELEQEYNNIYSKIINGAVNVNDGFIEYPEVEVDEYGATVLETEFSKSKKKSKLPAFSINTLLNDYEKVDFIHFDVQGIEYDIIASSLEVLSKKVRFMCIGTHSRKIEGDLISLLFTNEWQLLRENPCRFSKDERETLIDRTTDDGTQFWVNKKLSS